MQVAIEIVLPVFALILCGHLFARGGLMGEPGVQGISDFVFFLAIPALLFRSTAGGALSHAAGFDILFAYYLPVAGVYLLAMALVRWVFRLDFATQAIVAINATFSNAVLIGIPLVFTAFGPPGEGPLLLIVSIHSLLLISLTTILVEIGRGGGAGAGRVAAKTTAALVRNPMLIAIALGSAWGAAGWSLPGPLDTFTRLLAGAAPPAALFALGATLAHLRVGGDLRDVAVIVALKLLLQPALVWASATWVFRLSAMETAVAVIVAALPTGANPFILAQRYGLYVRRSVSTVLISTVLSVASAALLLAWYAPGH